MSEVASGQGPVRQKPIDAPSAVVDRAKKIIDEVKDECSRRRSEDLKKWAAWEKQYEGRLDLPPIIRADANLDIPITREFVNQLIARLLNPIFQYDRVFIARPRRPDFSEDAVVAEDLADFLIDQVQLYESCVEWVKHALIYPFGVVKVLYHPPSLGPDGPDGARIDVSVVPPIHFFVSPGAQSINDAEWVAHRYHMSKAALKREIAAGKFKDEMKKIGDADEAKEPSIFAVDEEGGESKINESAKKYELFEVYFSENDKDGVPVEYILTFESGSGAILRLTKNPFMMYKRPFVAFTYEPIPGSFYGRSAAQMLEPIHRAYSASVNLRLVAAAKANNVMIIIPKGSGLEKMFANGTVRPGVYEMDAPAGFKVSDMIGTFTLSQPFSHLPQLEELLLRHAQKIMALTDYNFGIEQIQRPTATGQVQLIQEGKQALYMLLERFRKALGRVVMMMVARAIQYFPEPFEFYLRTVDGETAMRLVQIARWPRGLIERQVFFEPRVSSQSLNREMRKQEKLAFADKLPQIYQFMMTLAQQAAMPGPMAPIAQRLLIGYQAAVAQWMEEFEVEDLETLLPNVGQDINAVQGLMQFMQQMAAQQPGQPMGAGGVPGPPGAPGMAPSAPADGFSPGASPPPEGPGVG